jgi:CheY-like chemotaxis protein
MKEYSLNILMVDDDHIIRFIHKRIMELFTKFKIIYSEAGDGQEAIKVLNDNHSKGNKLPDLIFLDINMPVMDGFGFIEEFNKLCIPAELKPQIIMLSSSENSSDRQRCYELGVTKFLLKPISQDELETAICDSVMQPG